MVHDNSLYKIVGLYQYFFKKIKFFKEFSSLFVTNSKELSSFSKNSKFVAYFLNISIKKLLLKNGSFKQARTIEPFVVSKSSFFIIFS